MCSFTGREAVLELEEDVEEAGEDEDRLDLAGASFDFGLNIVTIKSDIPKS